MNAPKQPMRETVEDSPRAYSLQEKIEARKDKFDLRPALQFVARHIRIYESALERLMKRKPVKYKDSPNINFQGSEKVRASGPQITYVQATDIIRRLPRAVLELSMIKSIDYGAADIVPVPVFEDDGKWTGAVEMVKFSEFPRRQDHPSRIMIGRSNGKYIFPSPIPESVFKVYRPRWFYQFHVFLHEIWHTVEYLRRNPHEREKIILKKDGLTYSFNAWYEKWVALFLSEHPPFPSRYAATYSPDLAYRVFESFPLRFERALAEQICESFVGCMLGIAPNDENNPDFMTHSPQAWQLMNHFLHSEVIKK